MLAELYNLGTGDTFAQTGQYDQHQNIFELMPVITPGRPAVFRHGSDEFFQMTKEAQTGELKVFLLLYIGSKIIVYQENNPYFCEAKIKAEDISDITSGMQSAYKKYFYER